MGHPFNKNTKKQLKPLHTNCILTASKLGFLNTVLCNRGVAHVVYDVYIYICIYIYIYTYVYIYICIYIYVCVCVFWSCCVLCTYIVVICTYDKQLSSSYMRIDNVCVRVFDMHDVYIYIYISIY